MPREQSGVSHSIRDRQLVLGCFSMYLLSSDKMIGGLILIYTQPLDCLSELTCMQMNVVFVIF